MKKNILIVILLVVALASVIYANSQKSKADLCERVAMQHQGTIGSLQAAVDRLKMIADQNLQEAMLQSRRADDAVAKCEKLKK